MERAIGSLALGVASGTLALHNSDATGFDLKLKLGLEQPSLAICNFVYYPTF